MRLGNNVYVAQGSVLRSVDDSLIIGNSSMVKAPFHLKLTLVFLYATISKFLFQIL
jgi:acetyltransferase-like isoleucine patch superfamily enzyme